MRSLMRYVMIPLAAAAATAIPTDPARAADNPCPKATAVVAKAVKAKPSVALQPLVQPCLEKLEAI